TLVRPAPATPRRGGTAAVRQEPTKVVPRVGDNGAGRASATIAGPAAPESAAPSGPPAAAARPAPTGFAPPMVPWPVRTIAWFIALTVGLVLTLVGLRVLGLLDVNR